MIFRMMGNALIAFGGNLGDVEATYSDVISRLHATHGIGVMGAGRLFDTTPVGGPPNQPRFKNGAILVDVSIPPEELLASLQEIERSFGRLRGEHWGARSIDLDLLLYDDLQKCLCISTETLTLPHPRMHFRRFVLEPANQVAPDMVHPVFGFTLEELLAHLDRKPRIVAVAGDDTERVAKVARGIALRAETAFVETPQTGQIVVSEEFVTIVSGNEIAAPPPQLLLWLSSGGSSDAIPEELLNQLQKTRFSTWMSLGAGEEAAILEGAAATAAMRPFAAE